MTPIPKTISVIALDIANTIEDVITYPERQLLACTKLLAVLVGSGLEISYTPQQAHQLFRERFRRLHAWRLTTFIEPCPEEMWSSWMLPELPTVSVKKIADELTNIWMSTWYERTPLPNCVETVQAVKDKGYRVACISNTLSSTFTIDFLKRLGIHKHFEAITLSSDTGIRKPHPLMFEKTAEILEVPLTEICYVGDQLSRDVVGSINAGYGYCVLISANQSSSWHDQATIWPDLEIGKLDNLLSFL